MHSRAGASPRPPGQVRGAVSPAACSPGDEGNGLITTDDQLHMADICVFVLTLSKLVNDRKEYVYALGNIRH